MTAHDVARELRDLISDSCGRAGRSSLWKWSETASLLKRGGVR